MSHRASREAPVTGPHAASSIVATDPGAEQSARVAGLRYSSDRMPGLTRRRQGAGFTYWTADGRRVRDRATLDRIRALVIPPAWTDVWISSVPTAHLQCTGRDARGRKQYRYHARWRLVRDAVKYERLHAFGAALPRIRRRARAALREPALTQEKVLAALVLLLEKTLIRIGNDEYTRANGSFGLTTMRNRHVEVKGETAIFAFRGKSGVQQRVCLSDRRLARTIKRCQELPGQMLFEYEDDDGQIQGVDSGAVNDYLRELTGQDFTAKDFRTWAGTVLAAEALASPDGRGLTSAHQRQLHVAHAVEVVAKRLGNTKAVCRKCYIHPMVIDAYLAGRSLTMRANGTHRRRHVAGLSAAEAAVLELLRPARRARAAKRAEA